MSNPSRRATAAWLCLRVAGAAGLLVSCGGGSSPPPPPPSCTIEVTSGFSGALDWTAGAGGVGSGADGQGGVGIQVSLSVSPVTGARVTVRKSDGTALGTASTGSDGRVTFQSCGTAGPFLVEAEGAAGATYLDPAIRPAGAAAAFGSGQRLRAIVPALTANIGVTPWTEAVVRRLLGAGGTTAQPLPLAAAIDDAQRTVLDNAYRRWLPDALSIDSLTLLPATTTSATLVDRPADRYALALAALAQAAIGFNGTLPSPALTAAQQFALDAADGQVDGHAADGSDVAGVAQLAYAPGALRQAFDAGLAAAASRYAADALRNRLPAVLALGALALPDGAGSSTARVARLGRDGTVVLVAADGSDGPSVATNGWAIYGASQAPASALFVQRRDGTVFAIGDGGAAGLLGLGAGQSLATPSEVTALRDVTSISIGSAHALARKPDGSVLGWGDGARGGLVGASGVVLPQTQAGITQAVAVLALSDLSFALQLDGRVRAWGTGATSLGGNRTDRHLQATPQAVVAAGGAELAQVQVLAGFVDDGDSTLAALRRDGTVWTWGDNTHGGLGVVGAARATAAAVPGLTGIVGLAATDRGFVAVDASGALYFWGSVPVTGDAGLPTAYSEPFTPHRLSGIAAVRTVQPAFAGLYQARLYMSDGDRWQTDGVGARQTSGASELDVHAIAAGILTIGPVSGDGVVNAAERTAGVAVAGTITEADRPVTVQVGATSIAAQVSGTAWTAPLPSSVVPTSGTVTVSASFINAAGLPSAPTSRSFVVDAIAPALTISDDSAGVANGPVTFTFSWSEPPQAFGSDQIAVAGGSRGAFVQQSATSFTLQVAPPANSIGNLVVTVAAGAVGDAVGNPNAGPVSATQPFKTDLTPPTLAIADNGNGLATGPVTLTFTWSEPVVGFDASDIVVGNATPDALVAIDSRTYSMLVTPPAQSTGSITVSVAAGSVSDAADNPSVAAFTTSVPFDTNIVAIDYSGGPGGDSAGNGSAGDAGTPGNVPAAFVVDAQQVGSNLQLSWNRHASTGSDPDNNVAYYLVLRRASDTAPLTKFARIAVTSTTPPNARFVVLLDGTSATASYRIRACNGGTGTSGIAGDVVDENWCTDSTEFKTSAVAYPPEYFWPDTKPLPTDPDAKLQLDDTSASGTQNGSFEYTGAFTVSFTWNTAVGAFDASDISVDTGSLSDFQAVGTDRRTYSIRVTPPPGTAGTVTLTVRAGAVVSVVSGPSDETTASFAFRTP